MKYDEKWAAKLLKIIDRVREKTNKDKKSTAAYWNADDWGSIDGIRDSEAWVNGQVINAVLEYVNNG